MAERTTRVPPAPEAAPAVEVPPPRRSKVPSVFLTLLVTALVVLPLARPFIPAYNYVLQIMLIIFMWIALSSSWNIIGGFTGYISLGHNAFFAVGGYLSGMLFVYFGISPFLTAPLAGLVAVVGGLLFGLITLRTRGPAFIISTIALILMMRILFDNWEFIGGSNGLSLPLPAFPPPFTGKPPFYYAMLLTAMGAVYLSYRIQHSKFGLGLRAISQDEIKAEVAGIDTNFYKIVAFGLSAFFVAMAGAIWGYSLSYLRPTVFLTIAVAAEMVLMPIIGGRGTVAGPVVGAVLLIGINEYSVARYGSTELNIVVTGVILVIVLLFFPLGIVGTLREHGKLPSILDWD